MYNPASSITMVIAPLKMMLLCLDLVVLRHKAESVTLARFSTKPRRYDVERF